MPIPWLARKVVWLVVFAEPTPKLARNDADSLVGAKGRLVGCFCGTDTEVGEERSISALQHQLIPLNFNSVFIKCHSINFPLMHCA
jgi:hypothetical protein